MQQQQISDRFSAVMPGRRPGCAVQVLEQGAVPNTTIGTIPTIGFIGHDAQSGGNFIHHALSERCRRLLRDPLVYSAGVAVVETDERKVVTQARAKLVDNETVFCQAGDSDQVRGCPSAALGHVCRVRQCVIVRSPVLGIRQMEEMPITGKNEYSAKQGSTGLPEGWLEGLLEGLLEGFLDGLTLGTRLGLELGTWLGFLVPTGFELGTWVGFLVPTGLVLGRGVGGVDRHRSLCRRTDGGGGCNRPSSSFELRIQYCTITWILATRRRTVSGEVRIHSRE